MHILFLNPYNGGSHRAFARGWAEHSRHDISVLGLPARHWKWRMRHGAVTLASRAQQLDQRFDAVVTTDMLDLPLWRSYAPAQLGALPTVVYFHENQLTYPDDHKGERDFHFGFTNLFSAAAAEQVWFNSGFHRDELLAAWRELLGRMPDYAPVELVDQVVQNARVRYPGISIPASICRKPAGSCHLLWCARWEADKAPEQLFAALDELAARGVEFRISVLGQASSHVPELFRGARERLGERVVHWGWLRARGSYEAALAQADVVVSTARHEFFGIAVAEAVAAGAFPLVPRRLAYPELLADIDEPACFYGDDLVAALEQVCARHAAGSVWPGDAQRGRRAMARYGWDRVAPELDAAIEALSG